MKILIVPISEHEVPLGASLRHVLGERCFVIIEDVSGVDKEVRLEAKHLLESQVAVGTRVDAANSLTGRDDETNGCF